jgi:hypothetical protein
MSSPFEQPATSAELLGSPLWHLEFEDGSLCVAEEEQEFFLVLFTSSERADLFATENELAEDSPARPVLFSKSEEEFQQGVQQVADGGLNGAIIDPDGEDEDHVVVRFLPPPDEAEE